MAADWVACIHLDLEGGDLRVIRRLELVWAITALN